MRPGELLAALLLCRDRWLLDDLVDRRADDDSPGFRRRLLDLLSLETCPCEVGVPCRFRLLLELDAPETELAAFAPS